MKISKKAINKKQNAYQNFQQKKCDETEKNYKEKRNKVKTIVGTAHKMSWENFINKFEHDVHVIQTIAYKFLKSMSSSVRDAASITATSKNNWIEYFKSL